MSNQGFMVQNQIIPLNVAIKVQPPTVAIFYKRKNNQQKKRIYEITLNDLINIQDPSLITQKLFQEHSLYINESIISFEQLQNNIAMLIQELQGDFQDQQQNNNNNDSQFWKGNQGNNMHVQQNYQVNSQNNQQNYVDSQDQYYQNDQDEHQSQQFDDEQNFQDNNGGLQNNNNNQFVQRDLDQFNQENLNSNQITLPKGFQMKPLVQNLEQLQGKNANDSIELRRYQQQNQAIYMNSQEDDENDDPLNNDYDFENNYDQLDMQEDDENNPHNFQLGKKYSDNIENNDQINLQQQQFYENNLNNSPYEGQQQRDDEHEQEINQELYMQSLKKSKGKGRFGVLRNLAQTRNQD
ncbi:hypothetical protein PPERSA_03410 [Pseudocohnilembus persalinus]|uniref:Uncharacterized protein n=1 Tax=Pseudocohnilembus persalinus TaxID=266149 RepID=A0A0V0QBL6_PSEPJ|nr:hypothetical protein PPERSA_03410 [Pseudocohnilembus persalinus]|eukprot:KRW99609.1 hypothetical protein PPERSA_03410 [Pseudocohnilembus persalinus]